MKFGLILPIQSTGISLDQLWGELLEECQAAEAAGFDIVCLPEFHQARQPVLMSPMILGAQILGVTTSIRFAPAVLCGPLHHPVSLAEQFATLNTISGGRAVLGVGIGHQEPDFAAYGVNRKHRAAITDEMLEVIDLCFSPTGGAFAGHFHDVSLASPVSSDPALRPEIWIGAHSDAGLRRAARHGDLWISDPQRDIATAAKLAAKYRAEAARLQRAARVGLFREAFIGDSRADCERRWAPHALAVHRLYYNVGVYRERFEPWVPDVRNRDDFTLDRLAPGRFLMGSGDEIASEVAEWQEETGAEILLLRMRQPGGPDHDQTMEAIARFGQEVIPQCT